MIIACDETGRSLRDSGDKMSSLNFDFKVEKSYARTMSMSF